MELSEEYGNETNRLYDAGDSVKVLRSRRLGRHDGPKKITRDFLAEWGELGKGAMPSLARPDELRLQSANFAVEEDTLCLLDGVAGESEAEVYQLQSFAEEVQFQQVFGELF